MSHPDVVDGSHIFVVGPIDGGRRHKNDTHRDDDDEGMIGELLPPLDDRRYAVVTSGGSLLLRIAVLLTFFLVAAFFLVATTTRRSTALLSDHSPAPRALFFPPTSSTPTLAGIVIPFLVVREPDWRIIPKVLDMYEKEMHRALETLSIAIETLDHHSGGGGGRRRDGSDDNDDEAGPAAVRDLLRDKIDRLERIYAHDLAVLRDVIVRPFAFRFMLPAAASSSSGSETFFTTRRTTTENPGSQQEEEEEEKTAPQKQQHAEANEEQLVQHRRPPPPPQQQFIFAETQQPPSAQQDPNNAATASASYESVRQVVAHLVRDWSELGVTIRAPLYDWCSNALATYGPHPDVSGLPVLVPGAGLGRLAWQLAAVDGYTVEALESSTVMAAAAHAMLLYYHDDGSASSNGSSQPKTRPPLTIHPHAADPFSNEVDGRQRYESCRVPDVNATRMIGNKNGSGRLSYTVAVFDKITLPSRHYGAVVTCFFIDTATTLVDYVSTVRAVLRHGGIWINIGPLQWHGNSKVPLAADELRVLLTSNSAVFTVLHWSVDETVLNYRDASSRSTAGSTFADGYRPLRFVLRYDDGIRTGS